MRLFVDITAHGWGHLSQTAPIMAALRQRMPQLQCIARSGLPESLVEARLGGLGGFHASTTDFGVVMASPFVVDRSATFAKYSALHENFEARVDELAAVIRRSRCDAVFSNVGYLAIAAGARVQIPTIACSSLNWSDMIAFYCAGREGLDSLMRQVRESYESASAFFKLTPGMPMAALSTRPVTSPIASIGSNRRDALRRMLGISDDRPIVHCAFGGMVPQSPPAFLTERHEFVVLGPRTWGALGVVPVDDVAMSYADVLASVDVVISKPGYGVVAELGCLAKPSIMISRGDWPEENWLTEWLSKHCTVVRHTRLDDVGNADVRALVSRSPSEHELAIVPKGAQIVADGIAAMFPSA